MRARRPPQPASTGFTLIEVLLASLAAAIILAALYGVFARAVKLRDQAMARTKEARLRSRALSVMRNDLLNGHVVSTDFGGNILGAQTNPDSSSTFPGYLRFTTSTGRDSADTPFGDTQEVEYYISSDNQSDNTQAGVLVRTVDRVLLAQTRAIYSEERLLPNLESMDVEFYDGTDWQTSWDTSDTTAELPQAVRVTLHPYAGRNATSAPPAIELLVPWETKRP